MSHSTDINPHKLDEYIHVGPSRAGGGGAKGLDEKLYPRDSYRIEALDESLMKASRKIGHLQEYIQRKFGSRVLAQVLATFDELEKQRDFDRCSKGREDGPGFIGNEQCA